MAACVLRRGLLSSVGKYGRKRAFAALHADLCGRQEVNGHALPCSSCGVAGGAQARFLSSRPEGKILETVGVFEAPKQHGKYETGQLFLHSVFGYRGIVLFPWHARLYDRDVTPPTSESKSEPPGTRGSKEVKGKTHTYYQVLIDTRDCPHISQRSQTEAVTFLANHDDSRALYAIPGLDYVSHEDVLPYSSTDQVPIQHELFERFLTFNPSKVPPFVPRDTLRAWQEKNHPWLELSDVHRETTENIRVTVIPFYMGMREAQNSHVYWWRYCIRLENMGNEVVQLRERHWRIFSLSGTLETVRGRGVVGREPVLSKEQPAFQYSSHVSLQAPSGHMWGTFRIERTDGSHFDVRIPPFSLESNKDEKAPPAGYSW
ncbi:polymerase delta-interacting protein 2-like isoform X2 [Scleropages formosus]|uniref:polymerase delta-interacting protein 2-like isoform X2 n=1 Tax=Scleropages formosus TaxID=113540 RepID=UPI0008781262|nr:polymerase delta-interacting protein 2-like isoform X2 [Scleropages formosus]